MHLAHIKIENIRNLGRAEWRAPADQAGGWRVVPGENASGKTTFLRSIARTLLGFPGATQELDPNSWRREGAARGSVDIVLRGHAGFDKGELDPGQDEVASFTENEDGEIDFSHLSEARGFGTLPNTLFEGWLSLGYGPYRRFTGGESRLEKYATPAYAPIERHLTLFNEGAVLPEGVLWINKLGYRQLEEQNKKKTTRNGGHHEANGEAGSLMKNLRALLGRPGLLPHGAKLAEVSSEGLFFTIGRGKPRGILQLSDGYKSILSMFFDILRNMERSYGPNNIFDEEGRVVAPAVILIDEIDVHLHPIWQQKIGVALKRAFPNAQFIVTTHSPIVCQAADSLVVLRKGRSEQLEGVALDRMRYGNILDAFSTGVFGEDIARSKTSFVD